MLHGASIIVLDFKFITQLTLVGYELKLNLVGWSIHMRTTYGRIVVGVEKRFDDIQTGFPELDASKAALKLHEVLSISGLFNYVD